MKDKHILIGICGSFCNHLAVLKELTKLCEENDVQVVVTDNVNTLSTRFFDRDVFIHELEKISGHKVIGTLVEAEKVGPNNPYDIMAIIPLTATICAKLVHGIYDSPVTLAAKAMIRNNKDIVIGFASNDGLGISGVNLMRLMAMKRFYVIPFAQDDPYLKPCSIVAKWDLTQATIEEALHQHQIQPVLLPSTKVSL